MGSIQSNVGDIEKDIRSRFEKACSVFRRLQTVWGSKVISLIVKLRLYDSIILSTALYAFETWKITTKITNLLDVFHLSCFRKILKISWRDKIRTDEVLSRAQPRNLSEMVAKRRIQLTGHIFCLPEIRPAKVAMNWIPHGGKRHRGRPKKTWRATAKKDLRRGRSIGIRLLKLPKIDRSGIRLWPAAAQQLEEQGR